MANVRCTDAQCNHVVRHDSNELSTPSHDGDKPTQMITLGAVSTQRHSFDESKPKTGNRGVMVAPPPLTRPLPPAEVGKIRKTKLTQP